MQQHEYLLGHFQRRVSAPCIWPSRTMAPECARKWRGARAQTRTISGARAPGTPGSVRSAPSETSSHVSLDVQILKCFVDGRRGIWPRLPPNVALGDRAVSVGGKASEPELPNAPQADVKVGYVCVLVPKAAFGGRVMWSGGWS